MECPKEKESPSSGENECAANILLAVFQLDFTISVNKHKFWSGVGLSQNIIQCVCSW